MRIEATDRAGLERLLRYCAQSPFAMDRLKQHGADLVLTPLELIDRIAQLVPPPRTHRHRYYGVLAPNSPLRAAVTAMAQLMPPALPVPVPLNECGPGIAVAALPDTETPTAPPAIPKACPPSHPRGRH